MERNTDTRHRDISPAPHLIQNLLFIFQDRCIRRRGELPSPHTTPTATFQRHRFMLITYARDGGAPSTISGSLVVVSLNTTITPNKPKSKKSKKILKKVYVKSLKIRNLCTIWLIVTERIQELRQGMCPICNRSCS